MPYTTRLHRTFGAADGIHQIHHWETDNLEGLTVESADIGKVARIDTGGAYTFWLLTGTHPSEGDSEIGEWREIAAEGFDLSDDLPVNVVAPGEAGGDAGVSALAARADHKHVADVAEPIAIGMVNEEGTSVFLSRSDHVHDGTPLLAAAAAAFEAQASTDLPTDVLAYTETIGEDETTYTGESLIGEALTYARSDHQHATQTAAPVSIGTVNDEGTGPELARADHVHDGTPLLLALPTNYGGTALTLTLAHVHGYVRTTNAAVNTITIPLGFSDMPVGASISGIQAGAGRTQFIATGGVTLNCAAQLYTRAQYSGWTIYKVATNEYDLSGDLLV